MSTQRVDYPARFRVYDQAYRERHVDRVAAAQVQYDLDHPGRRLELARASRMQLRRMRGSLSADASRKQESAKWAALREAAGMGHLSPLNARQKRYALAHPGRIRAKTSRRRVSLAGVVLVVDGREDVCSLCREPLDFMLRFPDPMFVSIGHEPPLAVVAAEGWLVVCERFEHLVCNMRKGPRTDGDLTAVDTMWYKEN